MSIGGDQFTFGEYKVARFTNNDIFNTSGKTNFDILVIVSGGSGGAFGVNVMLD